MCLNLCCFVVYSTRRFVLCLILCYFGFVFFSPFSIAITSLGEERANLGAFRTFVRFVLVWICRFPLPLGVWEGLRSVIVALGLFSYLFFFFFFFLNATLNRNASFKQNLGYASAFQRNNNGPNNPKGNKNIICTMVKYGESFYGRNTVLQVENQLHWGKLRNRNNS